MNAHTKQQQDKVFETDFIDSQKSDPPFAHLLALSHICVSLQRTALYKIYYYYEFLDGVLYEPYYFFMSIFM